MDIRLSGDEPQADFHMGATLLVVDDNPDNIAVLGAMLQPLYRVRVATSGARALEIAVTPPEPELILLDRMMPGMDGDEVLARLKLDPRTASIPVIFVTAMSSTDDECAGLGLGAVDYLTKPLVPALVLARVRTQLELKHARDRLRDMNASLEDEVARRMAENQIVQDVTVHALARLAEIRDAGTGNHLRRTRAYMRLLASRLRDHPRFCEVLAGDGIELLAKSALLHDIGKVGIPDSVLLKPGRLDPVERALMETHAMLGAEAIANAERDAERPIAFLARAKEIARHHHERWDGSGYPDRLAGEAIPASARLMALVDSFDTMASRRPYKQPIPLDVVRAALVAERGRQFDPDVVDAFDAAFDDFARIAASYRDEGSYS